MEKQLINKKYEKIKNILKTRIYNIHIFFCISLIYALDWIIDLYNSGELDKLLKPSMYVYEIKYLFISTLGYMFFVYLPIIIMWFFDFIVKKYMLINNIVIKIIRILIIFLGYIYFALLGILIAIGSSMFR